VGFWGSVPGFLWGFWGSVPVYPYTWGSKDKFSSKGVQNATNICMLRKEEYRHSLDSGETLTCHNKGFRYIDKTMKTYEQEKIGLTPIYVKGVVMDDGVHIHPLSI